MEMEMFEKDTKNQHFISVAEQTLNQSNPEITKRNNRSIYSFDLEDRESHHIVLSSKPTPKAVNNLSYLDLFTFGILDDGNRLCFEKLFDRLECDLIKHTDLLLSKEGDEYENFIYIFKSKLMNMIRNPFCINATVNNFGDLGEYYPVNECLKDYFDCIEEFQIPENILNDFDVNEVKYKKWLKIIFLMITPLQEDKYILDEFAENYFNYEKFFHIVKIFSYTDKVCLLSDRSYVDLTSLFINADGISYGFNLRKDAFVYISLFKNDIQVLIKQLLNGSDTLIGYHKELESHGLKQLQYSLQIGRESNNIEILKNFNRHVIYQCNNNVYAANTDIEK